MCSEKMVEHGHNAIGSFTHIKHLINQIAIGNLKARYAFILTSVSLPVEVLPHSIHRRCHISVVIGNKSGRAEMDHLGNGPVIMKSFWIQHIFLLVVPCQNCNALLLLGSRYEEGDGG